MLFIFCVNLIFNIFINLQCDKLILKYKYSYFLK